jgi:hypothetical protein
MNIVLILAAMAVFLGIIAGGYILNWQWTGFRGNTLWDWLKLLVLPVVLAIGGLWFNAQQSHASRQVTLQQHQTDIQIASDRQQEDALDTYLEQIAQLLLDKQLKESHPESDVREVARVRTLTAVWRVGKYRKGVLLKFLYEAGLIEKDSVVIDLAGADLSHAHLFGANLSGANLHGANLSGANLEKADLSGAILEEVNLSQAQLQGANMNGAYLYRTNLSGVNLEGVNLGETHMMKSQPAEYSGINHALMGVR